MKIEIKEILQLYCEACNPEAWQRCKPQPCNEINDFRRLLNIYCHKKKRIKKSKDYMEIQGACEQSQRERELRAKKEKYVIDIDNHLLYSDAVECDKCGRYTYELMSWNKEEIAKVNKLYEDGHMITLWTGRGWDIYDLTVRQLKKAGVKYHSLVMGKPLGIYVDKESRKTIEGD